MASGWTPERRARQSALIRRWKPWECATGPISPAGKVRTARNAYKGGHWRELRDLRKIVNELLRDQRAGLREVLRYPQPIGRCGPQ